MVTVCRIGAIFRIDYAHESTYFKLYCHHKKNPIKATLPTSKVTRRWLCGDSYLFHLSFYAQVITPFARWMSRVMNAIWCHLIFNTFSSSDFFWLTIVLHSDLLEQLWKWTMQYPPRPSPSVLCVLFPLPPMLPPLMLLTCLFAGTHCVGNAWGSSSVTTAWIARFVGSQQWGRRA